jgi:hypothetical protein
MHILQSGRYAGISFPLTGLVIDFDVSDSSNRTTSGGRLTSLTDPISGNVMTPAYGTGPIFNAGVLNGKDTVSFVPGNAIWDLTAAGLQSGDLSMYVVAQITGAGGGMFSCCRGGGGCEISAFDTSGFHRVAYSTDTAGVNSTTENWTVGSFDIMLLTRTSGNWELYRNGTSVLTSSTSMSGPGTALALGFRALANGGDLTGDAARAGIYDHALNSSERLGFFITFGTLYGITIP